MNIIILLIVMGNVIDESNGWDNGNSHYWLRSPGLRYYTNEDEITGETIESFTATTVYTYGEISLGENIISVHVGVRPAIWVEY